MATLNFNSSQHQEVSLDRDPIKNGWYPFSLQATAIESTKTKSGMILKFEAVVLDGPNKGYVLYDHFNIVNQNDTATKIGNGMLSLLANAIGVPVFTDTVQLHNRAFLGKVRTTADAGYGPKNEFVKFLPVAKHSEVIMAWLDTTPQAPVVAAVAPAAQAIDTLMAPATFAPAGGIPGFPAAPAAFTPPAAPAFAAPAVAPVAPQAAQAPAYAVPEVPSAPPAWLAGPDQAQPPAPSPTPQVAPPQPDWAQVPATQAQQPQPAAPTQPVTPAVAQAQAAVPPWAQQA